MPEATPTLSRRERTAVWLDHYDEAHHMRVGDAVGLATGVGTALGTYVAVKELGFPANDQYEAVLSQIDQAEASAAELESASETYAEYGLQANATEAQDAADQYTAEAAEAKDNLPDNYSPHIEGFVSGTSALVLGVIVGVGLARRIRSTARRARSKTNGAPVEEL